MATPANPIRVFVTHAWQETDDYLRIFEYLESPGTFYYANTSQPLARRPADRESEREELRRQIAPSEVVIVLPSIHRSAPELILFELNFAKSADRAGILRLERAGAEADTRSCRRGRAMERSRVDRRAAPPGASYGDDALGYDRVQARLKIGALRPSRSSSASASAPPSPSSAARRALIGTAAGRDGADCVRQIEPKISTIKAAHSSAC